MDESGGKIAISADDIAIDSAMRADVIEGVLSKLHAHYIFPVVAQEILAAIHLRQDNGEYDALATAAALRDALIAHMQEASRDKHLQVRYEVAPRPLGASDNTFDDPAFLEHMRLTSVIRNYGFERVEWLRGNIGYLDLRFFAPPEWSGCGDTAVAAMTFLANTSALIVDLRRNGGAAGMVDLLCSYVLPAVPERPVHLIDFHYSNRLEQHWTLPHVPGPRYEDKPVYLLIGERTTSAAEAFAYTLQALGRATLMGETTAGAGNLVGHYQIDAHFSVFISNGRVVVPSTGGNWEGVGVQPDLAVPPDDALRTAHIAALRKVHETIGDAPTGKAMMDEAHAALTELEE